MALETVLTWPRPKTQVQALPRGGGPFCFLQSCCTDLWWPCSQCVCPRGDRKAPEALAGRSQVLGRVCGGEAAALDGL